MLLIDAHLDLAWNALQWNRDLTQSAYTLRTLEAAADGSGRGQNTVCLPEMRRGEIGLCFATLLARSTGTPRPHVDFPTAAQALAAARGQMAYYCALETEGRLRVLTTWAQVEAHVTAWNADSASTPIGVVISMESADPILRPDDLAEWFDIGVRLIGPAHYGMGRYAGGTSVEGGLTEIGVTLLRNMQQQGIGLDLTHLSDAAFWQALDIYSGPVLASHNNARTLVPHQRQFDDAQLRAIFERGGVIGAAFDAWMLQTGWIKGATTNEKVTLNTVVDHIDYICQLAGNSDHAAIGSDLDGGYGREQSPCDMDTIADLQRLTDLLSRRGYSEANIAAIMHGNWLRFLKRTLPE
ncbi:MAG: membrane dipeptidase [Burkholderiales bacterium]|nr:membrane dipeptidase [Anaerolineae bacterium]